MGQFLNFLNEDKKAKFTLIYGYDYRKLQKLDDIGDLDFDVMYDYVKKELDKEIKKRKLNIVFYSISLGDADVDEAFVLVTVKGSNDKSTMSMLENDGWFEYEGSDEGSGEEY
jgi:hypothetical protein